MSIVGKVKDEISKAGQRSLGIDDVRFKLDVGLQKLDAGLQKRDLGRQELSTIGRLKGEVVTLNNQITNLKSFLTWYSNRVEPWFWTGNFALSDPEEELAGAQFLYGERLPPPPPLPYSPARVEED
jgi:hypothetical protein